MDEYSLYEEVPREYLNRGHYMEQMMFPKNSPQLIVIPSNRKGTGFIKTCYDPRYLPGILTQQEFNFIIEQASIIAYKVYSDKRKDDSGEIPRKIIWMLTLAYFITMVVLALMLTSTNDKSHVLDIIAYSLLGTSLVLAISVMLINFRSRDCKSHVFNQIVKG